MKARYRLTGSNMHGFVFVNVNAPSFYWGAERYYMPRWRWARMCEGRWPA